MRVNRSLYWADDNLLQPPADQGPNSPSRHPESRHRSPSHGGDAPASFCRCAAHRHFTASFHGRTDRLASGYRGDRVTISVREGNGPAVVVIKSRGGVKFRIGDCYFSIGIAGSEIPQTGAQEAPAELRGGDCFSQCQHSITTQINSSSAMQIFQPAPCPAQNSANPPATAHSTLRFCSAFFPSR